MYDISGYKDVRKNWNQHFYAAKAVIFVVDSFDRVRFEEGGEAFQEILLDYNLKGLPLLVFANKQDMLLTMTCKEITTAFNIHMISDR